MRFVKVCILQSHGILDYSRERGAPTARSQQYPEGLEAEVRWQNRYTDSTMWSGCLFVVYSIGSRSLSPAAP